jgi:hypothetical protein
MIVKKVRDLFKKSMVMDKDFDLDSDFKNEDTSKMAAIKILTGRYKGITFCFGGIRVEDRENPDGTYTLHFDYDILKPGKHDPKKLEGSQAFTDTLGAILNSIIIAGIERERETHDEETGNNYTEESDTKRRVRKKGSSVSE